MLALTMLAISINQIHADNSDDLYKDPVKNFRTPQHKDSAVRDFDYPRDALMKGEQGVTHFALVVGTDGRVKTCRVEVSSGSDSLDKATCEIMSARARFTPARNTEGKPVEKVVRSKIRWILPIEPR
ncbi:MAG TPA: energy transducer TonB [Pseudolabrys sp.]|nr:energy transducer TonB [Pseudolabrys sp.]